MRKAIALLIILAALATAKAVTVETWSNTPSGSCQASVAPAYYCFVTLNNGNMFIFYVHPASDGTFANGTVREVDHLTQMDLFNATNWAGANLSGGFSGVLPDGTPFNGSATEVIGRCRRGGYKGTVSYVPCVMSGSGAVTFE